MNDFLNVSYYMQDAKTAHEQAERAWKTNTADVLKVISRLAELGYFQHRISVEELPEIGVKVLRELGYNVEIDYTSPSLWIIRW